MEEVLRYINEAQYYIDSFRDISLADSFFEESEIDKEINKDNEKAKTGALASLKKAFGKLVDLVKKLYNNVKEFFAQKFMNKEDKKRFNEFKALVKSMPEYSKVKVTIADFRAYEKAFNEAEKELESASKKEDFSESTANGIIDRLNKALNNDNLEMLENERIEKFENEIADIIVCCLIVSGYSMIDIEKALNRVMEKNRLRAEKQGDKL